jgi:Brp/Blh family beta-carotene 15,15'-monooxygenase
MIENQFRLLRIFFIVAATMVLIINQLHLDNVLFYLTFCSLLASGTIGLAHGGLDWPLAKLWGLRANRRDSIVFILAYLLCVAVTLAVWHFIPSLALLLFILMSVIHFAGDWREEMNSVDAYMLGIAVICLPTLNFSSEVSRIFALLLSDSEVAELITLMYYTAIFTSLLLGLKLVYLTCLGKHLWLVLEVLVLMLIGITLPPLVYFGLYFCFLHAPKHWVSMRKIGLYTRLTQGIRGTLWPTLLSIALGLVAIYYAGNTIAYTDALCKTVFIGLAALTVPHWRLIEIYGNRHNCQTT